MQKKKLEPADQAAENIVDYLNKRLERNDKRRAYYREMEAVHGLRYEDQKEALDEEDALVKTLLICIWTKADKVEYRDEVFKIADKALACIETEISMGSKDSEEILKIAKAVRKELRGVMNDKERK